jgi:hypothetical protein
MSEVAIFIVGSIIFAITVYGSVMGGGIALGRLADGDDEHHHPEAEPVIATPPDDSPSSSEPADPA